MLWVWLSFLSGWESCSRTFWNMKTGGLEPGPYIFDNDPNISTNQHWINSGSLAKRGSRRFVETARPIPDVSLWSISEVNLDFICILLIILRKLGGFFKSRLVNVTNEAEDLQHQQIVSTETKSKLILRFIYFPLLFFFFLWLMFKMNQTQNFMKHTLLTLDIWSNESPKLI